MNATPSNWENSRYNYVLQLAAFIYASTQQLPETPSALNTRQAVTESLRLVTPKYHIPKKRNPTSLALRTWHQSLQRKGRILGGSIVHRHTESVDSWREMASSKKIEICAKKFIGKVSLLIWISRSLRAAVGQYPKSAGWLGLLWLSLPFGFKMGWSTF